jgi:predicted nucleic acid-binding protein
VTVALEAPRFLLDTNVYLDLVDGLRGDQRERLLKVAAHATPPLLWACEVTFEELMSRLRLSDQRRFERHRKALWWMEKLTGVAGMAEDRAWIKRRGVFVKGVPHDAAHGEAMVAVRREILRTENARQLSRHFRSIILSRRRALYRSITRWVAARNRLGRQIRRWIAHEKARGVDVRRPIAEMVVDATLERGEQAGVQLPEEAI